MAKKIRTAESSEVLKQYQDLRRNLLRQANKLEKAGFTGARSKVPEIPEKITSGSVRRLQQYAQDKYRKLKEGLSGSRYKSVREYEYEARKERTAKGQRTKAIKKEAKQIAKSSKERNYQEPYFKKTPLKDETMTQSQWASTIIDNFLLDMGDYNDAFFNYMSRFIDSLKGQYSDAQIAQMIRLATEAGVEPSYAERYEQDKVLQFTKKMFSYLPADESYQAEITRLVAEELMNEMSPEFDKMRDDYRTATRSARKAYRKQQKGL